MDSAFQSASQNSVPKSPGIAPRASLLPWLLIASAPALFALTTWGLSAETGFGQGLRLIALPLCLVQIVFLLLAARAGWRPVRQFLALSPLVRLLLSSIVIEALAVAALRSPNPTGALVWTYLSVIELLFGLATAWIVASADEPALEMVWPAIVFGGLLFAAMVALFAVSPHAAGFDWQYFGLAVSNVRQIGFYVAVGALAAIGCAVDARLTQRLLFVAAATLMMTLAFWTGSRGTAACAVVAIGAGFVTFPQMRTVRGSCAALIPIPLGALVSMPLPRPIAIFGVDRMVESLRASTPEAMSAFRFSMWEGAWQAFLARPWFGYGEGQFGNVVPQPQGIYLHPHNVVLQSLFQWGVVGTIVLLGLGAVAVGHVRSALKTGQSGLLPAVLVCAGLFVFSLYDGALFHVYPVMMFAFALAFIIGSTQRAKTAGER